MEPTEAAKIVIAHVSDGVTLARKHHLPEVIINFIATHHGTSLTRYFYNTYVNAHPGEKVDKHHSNTRVQNRVRERAPY